MVAEVEPSFTVIVTTVPMAPPAPSALIAGVNAPVPVGGTTAASDGLLELITLLALPPETLTTPEPPSGMQSAFGATVNGSTGAAVPGVVVTSIETKAPSASLNTTLPGARQKFGLNTCTENASPLLVTVGGVIAIEPGNVVSAVYGGLPPKTKTLTRPVPQAAVVAPPRLIEEGRIDSGTFAPFAFRHLVRNKDI